jgi:predicted enzyme involved in methoxymalonyl-ACP biosynthesis
MGRKIEETMLYITINYAKSIGLEKIWAQYITTAKNKPCLDFWKKSGFAFNEKENIFTWNIKDDFPLPTHIEISSKNHD